MNKYLYINNNIDINIGEDEILINDFDNQVTHILINPYKTIFLNLLNHKKQKYDLLVEEVINFIQEKKIGIFVGQKYVYEAGGISTFSMRIYERELRIKTITIFSNCDNKIINGCYKAKKYAKNIEQEIIDRINIHVDKIIINVGYQPSNNLLEQLKCLCKELVIIIPSNINIKIIPKYTYIFSIDATQLETFDIQNLKKNVFINVEDQKSMNYMSSFRKKIINQSFDRKEICYYKKSIKLKPGNVTEYRRYYHPCLSMQVAIDLNGNLYYCSEYKKPFLNAKDYSNLKEIFNKKENYAIWTNTVAQKTSCNNCGYRYHCNDCISGYVNEKNYNCIKEGVEK